MKRKVARVMLVNAALTILGITIGMGMNGTEPGLDSQAGIVALLSSVVSTLALAGANLLVGFFTVLGTATLEVSEVRGWGKAMLLSGIILPLCSLVLYGMLVLAAVVSYRS